MANPPRASAPSKTTPVPYPDESGPSGRRVLGVVAIVAGVACLFGGVAAGFRLASAASWVLGGVILAAGIAILVWGIVVAVKASQAIQLLRQQWIASRGWQFQAVDRDDRPARFLGFNPFGKGHTRVARDIVAGAHHGMSFEAFNYSYQETHTTHGPKGQTQQRTTTYPFAILAVPMPISAPNLTLEPETMGKKLFDALGGEDIDFESDDFSRKFWVRCHDRKFAYDVIHSGMMEHLMEVGNQRTWEWRGPWLLVWTKGRMGIRDLDARLWQAHGFWSRIPRHLQSKAGRVLV